MANLSALLAVSEPSGFWITIIKAFEAVTNNYVLAIIFLTVVIRVIWAIVDTFSKHSQQKMSIIQSQMQPELDKIKAKYGNSPQQLNQKQNEVYKVLWKELLYRLSYDACGDDIKPCYILHIVLWIECDGYL